MVVTPTGSKETSGRMVNMGNWKNEIAHAKNWDVIKTRRLYQKMRTQPQEFTESEKKELRHRKKYGESRAETYRKLKDDFQRGKLNKKKFEKFKHAINMDEKWSDYKAFDKYVNRGLSCLTENEFQKANKFAKFNFGVPTFKAYKKMKNKCLGCLSEKELNELNKMEQVQVNRQEWDRAKDVYKAEQKGLVKQTGQNIELKKNLANMSKNEFDLISRIGFNISERTWEQKKRVKKAKEQGIVNERGRSLEISKPLRELSRQEVNLLQQLGFNLPSYSRIQASERQSQSPDRSRSPYGGSGVSPREEQDERERGSASPFSGASAESGTRENESDRYYQGGRWWRLR